MSGKKMIAKGHGREYTYKGRAYKHRSSHLAAQRTAKRAGRGLWSCSSQAPATEQPTTPPPAPPYPVDPPAPQGCVIKGNISDEGEKIYHVPGGRSYDQTVISPSKGERWFCSEAEALAAGWRKALA